MVKNVIVAEIVTTITSIRTLNAGGIAFSTSDTVETNPGNLYSNVNSFFSDLVLAGTGNAQITIGAGAGAVTESIVGVSWTSTPAQTISVSAQQTHCRLPSILLPRYRAL